MFLSLFRVPDHHIFSSGLDCLEEYILDLDIPADASHPLLQILNGVLDGLLGHVIISDAMLELQETNHSDPSFILTTELRSRLVVSDIILYTLYFILSQYSLYL